MLRHPPLFRMFPLSRSLEHSDDDERFEGLVFVQFLKALHTPRDTTGRHSVLFVPKRNGELHHSDQQPHQQRPTSSEVTPRYHALDAALHSSSEEMKIISTQKFTVFEHRCRAGEGRASVNDPVFEKDVPSMRLRELNNANTLRYGNEDLAESCC